MEEDINDPNYINETKIDYIKKFVDSQLDKIGVYGRIKTFVEENIDEVDEDNLINRLKEGGVIDEILEGFYEMNSKGTKAIDRNKRMIYFKLLRGKGFMDFLNFVGPNTFYVFDVLFLGQRFKSKKIPVSSEFTIDQIFLLDFNPLKLDINIDFETLKKLSAPIHIVMLTVCDDKKTVVSTKNLEWRWTLSYGTWKIEADMFSPDNTSKLNVGTLEIQMSMLPFVEKSKLLSERTIFDHINSEKKYETESAQDFIKYANDWWDDYKTIRQTHSTRLIKIFVPTEDRENYVFKPSTSLIEAITIGRAINTPFEAARFVSLIPYERKEAPGGQKVEIWNTTHTFFSVGKGDVEDHSVLLCNLLLGFGLDAYVAIGISINGPHVWVLTRNKLENKKYKVTYWESLTGQRINLDDSKIFRFYKKIHCVFNHNCFYSNIQPDDSVFNTLYHFEDDYLWKNIPSDKLEALVKYNHSPFMDAIVKDYYKIEIDLERDLKTKLQKYRKTLDLTSQFDNKLCHLLSPSIVNYEFERVNNSTYGNDEFKQSVKNYVPDGYTFKGFPLHTTNLDVDRIFSSILSNDVGKDIIYTRGDNARFAVRCKIFPYPQDIYSIWIMLAVKYRPIK